MICRVAFSLSLIYLTTNLTAQICDKDIPNIYISDNAKSIYESKLVEAKINFEKNNTLKKIEQDRNKADPDFYKGLGTFFLKKF